MSHDDVIKWKHFPRYWPFVRGIHRSPVNSPHKGQWRRALMFSLICVWINGWVNNSEAGDLGRYHAHYDVTVMEIDICCFSDQYTWSVVSCQSVHTDTSLATMWRCVPKPETCVIRYLEKTNVCSFHYVKIVYIICPVLSSGICWNWSFFLYNRDWDIFVGCMSHRSWNNSSRHIFYTVLIYGIWILYIKVCGKFIKQPIQVNRDDIMLRAWQEDRLAIRMLSVCCFEIRISGYKLNCQYKAFDKLFNRIKFNTH